MSDPYRYIKKYRATPRGLYITHKTNAKQRGIIFDISFLDWWECWQRSGHWEQRGNKPQCYVMCRYGDAGAYRKGNVYIGLFLDNLREARKTNNLKRRHTRTYTEVTFNG